MNSPRSRLRLENEMCACGKATPMSAMTSTEVNAMLEQARQQAQSETEAMVASAQRAAANASSNVSAQR